HYYHTLPSLTTTQHPHSLHLVFLNPASPPELHPLSLHDALPISPPDTDNPGKLPGAADHAALLVVGSVAGTGHATHDEQGSMIRSEEHTSELQSPYDLVCRLLLENKKHQKRPGHILAVAASASTE